MKRIKINFADMGIDNSYHKDFILDTLKQDYEVEISKEPDFLFCGEYLRYEYLKYKNCVRILINMEYEYPDYNSYDYVIGMIDQETDDRYLYYPIYMYRDGTSKYFDLAMKKHEKEYELKDKLFCNQLISNSVICDPYRFKIYKELSKYKKIDSAGSYNHNVSFEVGRSVDDKLRFSQNYKFSLAIENTARKGYVSEKIIEAWAAGTIPIYYGAEDIEEIFNKDAFIDCGNSDNIQQVIRQIIAVDQDDDLYKKMMNAPIVNCNSRAIKIADKKRIRDFLRHILNQEKSLAYRRERHARGVLLENEKVRLLRQSCYYEVINKLLRDNCLEDYLRLNRIQKVAVYGNGAVGKLLLSALSKYEDVTVLEIFDKALCHQTYEGIPILDIEKDKAISPDCIINTVLNFTTEIRKKYYQRNKEKVKILDLKDILDTK